MRKIPHHIAVALISVSLTQTGRALTIIDFEGAVAPDSGIGLGPGFPYSEKGFTFTSLNFDSAIFGAQTGPELMIGNPSAFLGFAETNAVFQSNDSSSPFSLLSLDLGVLSFAGVPTSFVTIIGSVAGGGAVFANFNVGSTTTVSLNWNNLTSVQFLATADTGIDNIKLSVPDSGTTLALLGLALAGLAFVRRRIA